MITSETIKAIISDRMNEVARLTHVKDKSLADIFNFKYYVFYDPYEDTPTITPVFINPSSRNNSFAQGYKSINVEGSVNVTVNVNKIALLEWFIWAVQERLQGIYFSDIIDGENCRYSFTFDNLVYSEVFKTTRGDSISITVPFATAFFITEDDEEVYSFQDYLFEVLLPEATEYERILPQSVTLTDNATQEALPLINRRVCGTVDVIKNRNVKLTTLDFSTPFLDKIRRKTMGLDNSLNEPVKLKITLPNGEFSVTNMNVSGAVISMSNNGVGSFDITLSPAVDEE